MYDPVICLDAEIAPSTRAGCPKRATEKQLCGAFQTSCVSGLAVRRVRAYARFKRGGGRMSKSYLVVCALLAGYYSLSVAEAADRAVPRTTQSVRRCGCCGCLHVFYDYHRELRATYGAGMDPRNYDQTEPHYYFGPVRAYPQYWSDRNGYELHY
jgi:hypothetical protein